MTMTPKTLIVSAGALAALLVVLGGLGFGVDFAAGVAVSAGLVLVNLLAWVAVGRRLVTAVLTGRPPVLGTVLLVGKLGLLVAGVLVAAATFPPLSVLLGSSAVVGAILAWALVGAFTQLEVEET